MDMIVQNVSHDGTTDLSFTLPRADVPHARTVIEKVVADVGGSGFHVDEDIAKVSLVGAGMRSHPGVAAQMFEALSDAQINIEMISTSSIRVSCVIRAGDVERAVQALHASCRPVRRRRLARRASR